MTKEQQDLFNSLDIEIQCRLARRAYNLAVDFLDDFEYKELMERLPATHILNYTKWEDDDLTLIQPYLKQFGLEDKPKVQTNDTNEQQLLNKFLNLYGTNLSIAMVDNFELVKQNFCPQLKNLCNAHNIPRDKSAICSLKVDGWNITCYFSNKGLELAHTRAKDSGKPTICTEQMRILTEHVNFSELPDGVYARVVGELAMDEELLPILREDYSKDFVNTRNSVSSIVSNTIDIKKYKNLVYYFAFNIQTTDRSLNFETQEDVFIYLTKKGFMTPAYVVFDGTDFNNYMAYFNNTESFYINTVKPHVCCDGTVLQSNYRNLQQDITPTRSGSYSMGMLAVKAGYWARKIYKTVIQSITYTETRVNSAVVLVVEPTKTDKGTVVSNVPITNLSRALSYNLRKGTHIKFSMHSQQIVEFEGVCVLNDEC